MGKILYNLTASQKSIWFTEQYHKNTNINNVCGVFETSIPVDLPILEESIKTFVKNNESFRTRLILKNGIIKQYFSEYIDFPIDTVFLNSYKERIELEKEISSKGFKLLNSQLFRFTLFKYPNGNGGYIINSSHIISDSWSSGIVVNEISTIYNNIKNHKKFFKDNELNYSNYIKNEQKYIKSEKFNKDKQYWNSIFKDIPEQIAKIPSEKQILKNNNFSYHAKRYLTNIDSTKFEKLKKYAKKNKVSLYNLLIGIFALYISRVSNLDDLVIGTPILNRTNFKEKQTTGMFINVLPLRINLKNIKTFNDFISQITINSMGLLRHQKYSYNYIIDDLRKRDSSIPNLYNILLSYQITKMNENNDTLPHKTSWTFNESILNDLELHIFEWNDTNTLQIAYDYKTSKYSKKEIININKRILYIIDQILENENLQLENIEIITKDEKNKILHEFNNTKSDYPKNKTISQLFEEQVEKNPNDIALMFEDQKLTYKELNEKANSLANYLINNGLEKNNVVSIFLDKSLETIIAILGIIKCGCAYMPIDLDYPDERITYMIKSSKSQFILTSNVFKNKFKNYNHVFNIELENEEIYKKNCYNPNIKNNPNDLAYIMFTSGSTGEPKGVMITNKNVIRLVKNNNFIKFEKNENILQTGSIVFDACTFEIWGSLLNGFILHIIKKQDLLDPIILAKYLEEKKISILWITAPLFNQLSENNPKMFKNVRILLTGGDVLSPKHINKVRNACPNLKIINGYGPTENTTFSTCYTIEKNYKTSIPIGFPISNSTCYIVSKNMKLMPIGMYGELLVGGDGVSKGYLNKPDYTNEKFIPNIFGDGILYKTGDLARWNSDGSIEFAGRIDNQVKIRGYRVELGEITLKIKQFQNIKECITVVKNINNQKMLCSYISSNIKIDINQLKKYLKKILPIYSIPTYFIQLDIFPINTNGKIDIKKLPEPENISISKETTYSLRNDIDKKLINILKNILNITTININDSFFDLGGDSLNAINLSAKIQSEFNVEIFVKDIFNNPIISEISDLISLKISTNLNENKLINIPNSNYYYTSSAQKNIYFASMLDGENSLLYNIPVGIIFDKLPDIPKLENCFNELIARHESFRTYFKIENKNIVQKVINKINFKLEILEKPITMDNLINEFNNFVKPFDFSKAPLLRSKVAMLDNNKAILFIDMHHIIADGTSIFIFINELCQLYNEENLEKIKFTYKDFAYWENETLNSGKFKEAEKFWLNQFNKNDIPKLNMPTKHYTPTKKSYQGSKVYSKIDSKNFEKINEICKKFSITPYILLLSIYYILLSKYTGQEDIIVGSPIVGRNFSELYNIIGMFVNTLPMRNKIDSNLSFKNFLEETKNICLENYKYQNYPINELINKLNIKRDTNGSPLFNTLFIYQNNAIKEFNFNGTNSELYVPDIKVSKYDLSLEIIPKNNYLALNFEYSTNLFTKKFIKNFANHYKNILNIVLNNLEIKISSICMLSEKEKNKILYKFNNSKTNYPTDKTIAQLFEDQVEKTPNNIAIVFEDKKLTYKELNEKSNCLANYLRTNGINRNDVVGIMLETSLETIISMIGILKSGAAYLLIDYNLPTDRINYMLENSNAKFLISNNKNLKFNSIIDINKIDFNTKIHNLLNINYSKDIFALIYTSGSTGLPKGVLLNNFGFINTIYNFNQILNLNKYNNHLNICNISFDMFSLELFISLLFGKKIILANEEQQKNPIQISNLILKHNIEFFMTTPSKMSLLLLNNKTQTCLRKLKAFLLGGEVFSKSLYSNLKKYTNAIIYNGYGPTEVSACCSIKEIKNINDINIGKPMFNTNIFILDKNMNLCPNKVPGEIYVSGNGIALGYINNYENTQKSFINFNNTILYKTGDLGFFIEKGELEYIGRNDFQIKLHGLRIELNEIDNIIMNINGILKSVTICNEQKLISFFKSNIPNLDTDLIKKQLYKKLPNYMIPSKFIQIDNFPISSNGKIDLKTLSSLVSFENTKKIILPKNDIEKKLYNIFCNLLNVEKISTDESFFDLGGDSLSAIKLIVEISDEFNKNITIKDIFSHSNIIELSKVISSNKTNNTPNYNIKKATESSYYNLSEIQKSIFYATKLNGEDSLLYNISGGIIFDKLPDIKKLEKCLNELISRHESFRTFFEIENENIVQKISNKVNFNLEISENSNYNIDYKFKHFVKPLDFSKAPLFRAKIEKLDNNKAILFIDMHHIISDGASFLIFINELCKLYNDETLEKIEFTYKDYVNWEKNYLSSKDSIKAKEYWINQFKNNIPLLNLPTTYPRPSTQNFNGSSYYTKISKKDFKKIVELTKKLNITPYMLLLSIYYILLSKYSSQEDIIIGSPIANRTIPEFSNIIGMFVNTLALRNYVDNSLSFKEFANNVKKNIIYAFKYQSFPFEELIKNLNIKRDTSRNPLFNVMFNYQNNGYPKINFKNIKSKYYIPNNNISKFDLSLEVVPLDNEYSLRFEYSTKLFDKKFVKNFSLHYINILQSVLKNENIKIADIDMTSELERNQILNKFNNTKKDYPKDKNIIELFKEQVEKNPNKIAVSFQNNQLTYSELDKKSNDLANILIKNNINIGDIVGVCLNRSIELIISIFAILKVGGVYMPIYTKYPKDRLNYMLSDSHSKLLITNSKVQNLFSFDKKIILDNYKLINNLNDYYINKNIKPSNLAYIIYTSGSTGKPKGVQITHKNLINYIYSFKNYYKHISSKDSFLASTNISFDVSIWEIFLPLLSGAKLVLYNEEIITNIINYCKSIIDNNITALYIPPNILEEVFELLKKCDNIKINKILVGVEPIKKSTLNKFFTLNKNMCIINGYGPTETTICATTLNYKPNSNSLNQEKYVSIGKPLNNNKIYILNQFMKHQPIGIPGEIYISGDGVGNGYLNNPIENKKAFITIDNNKFYKTGDLAKWNYDGTISFIGRKDFQVKINGYRIELKEIDSIIMSFPHINKAYTITIQKGESHQLVSYFSADKIISINDLKSYLQSKLVFYMIPSHLMQIDTFPLTINGKIDTKSLPTPKYVKKNKYVAPRNELEKTIATILSSLLQIDKISIDDNFFDIGCDSLIAIKFQIEALKRNLDINYNNIFTYPTIRLLSEKKSNTLIYNIDKNYNYDKINILINKNKSSIPKKISKFKNNKLLLFGSTGFLGAHILDEYLSNNPNNIAYCIIRKKSLVSSKERFKKKLNFYFNNKYDSEFEKRIFVIEGDITLENLGISDEILFDVFNNADLVINSAAIVKHYGNSNLFNSTNVEGTQNIVNLCKKFNKKLYHISTLSVSGNEINLDEKNKIIYDESSFYVGQDLDNIYLYTKFEAEKIILEEINNGLNATILRIGNLTNRYSDGKFQINISENAFINKIKSIINLGIVQNSFLKHTTEFTPVDYCAKAIINILNTNNNYSILHLFNVNTIKFADLIYYINKLGYKLEPVTDDIFSKTVTTFLNDTNLKNKISGIATDLTKNKLLNYFSQNLINADITNSFLNKIGFSWPILDFEYFKKYFGYFKNINFF